MTSFGLAVAHRYIIDNVGGIVYLGIYKKDCLVDVRLASPAPSALTICLFIKVWLLLLLLVSENPSLGL